MSEPDLAEELQAVLFGTSGFARSRDVLESLSTANVPVIAVVLPLRIIRSLRSFGFRLSNLGPQPLHLAKSLRQILQLSLFSSSAHQLSAQRSNSDVVDSTCA